jgi:hypothetical protein
MKSAEPGNVVGLRIPAIPFFTNRTNFDLYSPHAFAANRDFIFFKNSTSFMQEVEGRNIRYFVLPNQNNYYYNTTLNLASKSDIVNALQSNTNFEHVSLRTYDIYKYASAPQINLIDQSHNWTAFYDVKAYSEPNKLNVIFQPTKSGITYNRVYLQTQLDLEQGKPILLFLDYATESRVGNATFIIEIRDKSDEKVLWSNGLENTSGALTRTNFWLPNSIAGQAVTFRLYAITEMPGEHYLTIRKAAIGYP